jgi:hypothetical protein
MTDLLTLVPVTKKTVARNNLENWSVVICCWKSSFDDVIAVGDAAAAAEDVHVDEWATTKSRSRQERTLHLPGLEIEGCDRVTVL